MDDLQTPRVRVTAHERAGNEVTLLCRTVPNIEREAPIPGTRRDRRSRSGTVVRCWSVEPEDGEQSGVDSPLFFRCEMADKVTESTEVNRTDLLNEHPSEIAFDVDLGPKRRRLGTGRCGCHQHHRPWKEGIGLHYDTESTTSLLVPNSLGESQGGDVTPAHGGSP
jgi:hypothetical protein